MRSLRTSLLALLLACTLSQALFAAPPAAVAETGAAAAPVLTERDLAAKLPTDPNLTIGKLPNGLTYYVRRNTKPQGRAEMWLAVNAGSVLEDEDQRGLAHFVEHMAFNGTHDFQKQELVQYLESVGMRFGADVNASTSFDETVYTLRVPTERPEYLQKGLKILQNWASGITFDPQEVDKERGVIVSEWRLGRGAAARMHDRQFPILFQGSRYAERVPIGDKGILENASPAAMQRFFRDWYRPDLMAVIAVGDFDRAQVETMIRETFGGLRGPAQERPRPVYSVPDHPETLFAIATDPEESDTSIAIYSKQPKRSEELLGDYRRSLVEGLYHSMLNERLGEIAHGADAPFLFAGSESDVFVRTSEVTYQVVGVKEGEIPRGLTALLTELERVRRHGFTPTELERAKKNLLRFYDQAYAERDKLESTNFAAEYVRNFTEGEPAPGIPKERELVSQLVPGITITEVNHLAAEWNRSANRVILVNAPEKDSASLPKEKDLLAVFKTVEASQVGPYVDRVADGPLVAEMPRAGTIIGEKKIAELGVTEWRLSNGVRVVLKPTDFQNDQILLSGFSPGGHSLVSDADFPSALFASTLLEEGGAGAFDEVTLEKALAGKAVAASPFISQLEEGIQGGASPRDVETLFQLAYLSLTSPRKDEGAFRSFVTKMEAYVANRLAEPEEVFQDKMTAALTQGHPRYRPLSAELLRRIDLDTAYRIYRDRFADFSDATFILVGNFTPDSIRPLVLTYLGGLPATGRKETWRDVGVRLPEGVVKVEVDKGLEPKAQVQLIFSGPTRLTRESRHDLNALASLLEVRLREILREDLGAVYGVQVSGNITQRPQQRYSFAVGFACDPEQVDSLVQAIFTEIEAIKEGGPRANAVSEVRETERREREVSLRKNPFWLEILETYYTEGFDPRDILRYGELIERVTAARLQATARQYLDEDRYVLGVLRPEGTAASKKGASGEAPSGKP